MKTNNDTCRKKCCKCKHVYNYGQFYKSNDSKDGYSDHCIECDKRIHERKKCSSCLQWISVLQYGKCITSSDGLQNYCKSCSEKYRRFYKIEKKCEKCGEIKSGFYYYESAIENDGLFHWCKNCCHVRGSLTSNTKHYEDYFSNVQVCKGFKE